MDFSKYIAGPVTGLLLGLTVTTAMAGEKVLATVNGEPITQKQLNDYSATRPNSAKVPNQNALLDELITREVVYQDAMKKNLEKDPQVQKELEQLRVRVLVSAAVQKALEKNPVTDKELHAEYDNVKDRMVTTEYKARHILVKDEKTAKKVIAKLNKGGDFDKLAREYSTGPTAKKGGELGWFNPHQMVPAFSDAVQKLKKGTYTKEPVKTRFGWHVIKLEDTRRTEPPKFEQVKPQLERLVQQKHVGEYIQKLKEKAKISIKK